MTGVALSLVSIFVQSLPMRKPPSVLVLSELVIALALFVIMLMVRHSSVKVLCACGVEICLFLACRFFFGSDSIITQIMCWITAAVACIVTVALVNAINWGRIRNRRDP